MPVADTCSRDGEYSSASQNSPFGVRTSPSVSRPDGLTGSSVFPVQS